MNKPSELSAGTDDRGFTLVEMLIALMILAGVLVSFASVLVVTTRFVVNDDVRGRASQVAARAVEQMRTTPWQAAAVSSPTSLCHDGELVRAVTAPAVPGTQVVDDQSGRSLTVSNAITWAGVACGAAQPAYGQLRMTSTVTWIERGKSTYTTTTNFRVPPADLPVPMASASPVASSPATPSPTVSASPSASASPSPTGSALVTPTFSDFLPQPPKKFCVYDNKTIAALPLSVNVEGVGPAETATLTWGTATSVSAVGGAAAGTKYPYAFTVPKGQSFSIGTVTFRIFIPATAMHTASTHVETFEVYMAKNSQKCA